MPQLSRCEFPGTRTICLFRHPQLWSQVRGRDAQVKFRHKSRSGWHGNGAGQMSSADTRAGIGSLALIGEQVITILIVVIERRPNTSTSRYPFEFNRKENNSLTMSRLRFFHVTPVDRSYIQCEFIKESIILFRDFSIQCINNTFYIICLCYCTRFPLVNLKRKQK